MVPPESRFPLRQDCTVPGPCRRTVAGYVEPTIHWAKRRACAGPAERTSVMRPRGLRRAPGPQRGHPRRACTLRHALIGTRGPVPRCQHDEAGYVSFLGHDTQARRRDESTRPPTRREHARAVAAARNRSPDTACGGTGPHVDANHTSRAVCWGLGPAQSLAAAPLRWLARQSIHLDGAALGRAPRRRVVPSGTVTGGHALPQSGPTRGGRAGGLCWGTVPGHLRHGDRVEGQIPTGDKHRCPPRSITVRARRD